MIRFMQLIIWIIIITAWVLLWKYATFENTRLTWKVQILEITRGGFQSTLIRAGANPIFTKLYLQRNTPDFELQKWNYIIPANADIPTFLAALKIPINQSDEKVTFLEGWNIYDIDKTLTQKELISAWDFSSFVTNCESFCSLKADYGFISDTETLEGFLYPDTYAINPNNFTIEDIVRKMLTNFQSKVIDSWIITDMGSIEILDILNMASIVQKEANKRDNPEEIAIIAGILKKRLTEWWQIWADATVCYPYKIATQDCTPTQVVRYLYEVNQYNTRKMTGLPISPIANPEAEVINATINSVDTPYYFYLHDNSGQIHYGVTNADHERNKGMYLR